MIKTLFGQRLWFNKFVIGTRLYQGELSSAIEKYLNSCMLRSYISGELKHLANSKIGDLVYDSSRVNGIITEINPSYDLLDDSYVLSDVIVTTTNDESSPLSEEFIRSPKSQKEIEFDYFSWAKSRLEKIRENPRNLIRNYEILNSGGHITDERGMMLKELGRSGIHPEY